VRVLLLLLEDDFRLSRRALARALEARGAEVIVMTAPDRTAECPERVRIVDWGLRRGGLHPLGELRALAEVVRAYRALRPTIVHHVHLKPVLYGGIAAALCGIPALHMINGLGYLSMSERRGAREMFRVVLALLRIVLRRGRTVVQNDDDRDMLVRHGVVAPGRISIIAGSGVDVARFAPAPEPPGPPIVLYAGRMLREKGVVEFHEAARRLRASGEAARFVLVGTPDPANPGSIDEAELRRWAGGGVVEWWGHRDDMPAVMAAASIVCVPSYGEGRSKVLMEAAAAGRPIVTTDVPGCRELVRSPAEGRLVPPRDAGALADAIASLLRSPEARAAIGQRGRVRAEREYADAHIVAQTLALYDAVLAEGRT
jgi:glycosyltransferase involved in cell wall biosynthesis